MKLRFLGYGNSNSERFGESSAVLEINQHTRLMIDCGHTALKAYQQQYAELPFAIYITHTHFDHIGGLEALFYQAVFQDNLVKLFVPAPRVEALSRRISEDLIALAEGGKNFWDAFQLIPVHQAFWYQGLSFKVFPSRHHAPDFCFGICLPGYFAYTGDTKPIPETLNTVAPNRELIFHDLSVHPQPSHTYLEELAQYSEQQLQRMWFYHLSDDALPLVKSRGLRCVADRQVFEFATEAKPSAAYIPTIIDNVPQKA